MNGFSLHSEDETAYHVRHPKGHILQIPKASAHPELVKAIALLPKAEPPKLADGGTAPPPAAAEPAPAPSPFGAPPELPPTGIAAAIAANEAANTFGVDLAARAKAAVQDRSAAMLQEANTSVARYTDWAKQARASGRGDLADYWEQQAKSAADQAGHVQDTALAYGVGTAPAPAPTAPAATPDAAPATSPQGQPQAAPAPAPAPTMPPMPSIPGYPSAGLEKAINTMVQTGREGADLKAKAEAQQAADMQAAHQQYIDNLTNVETKRQADLAAVQQEINAAQDDVKNFRLDPTHFWSSKGTGQKVTALIGVALGGIGSALTGQQNMALQTIQNFIDRDIEAQKLELGKKENLVGMLYRKYGNVEEAANAARSYLTALVAGQAGLAAARSGGDIAKANAKLLESNLQAQAIGPMAQIVNGKYQAAITKYQMDWQRQMFQWGMQMASGAGQQGNEYLPSRAPPPMGSDPMSPMKYAVESRKDAAERTVPGPGGRPFLAYDADTAKKVRPALAAAGTARKLLDELQALRANASGFPGTDGADQYAKTKRLFAEQWAMTLGQTSLSDTQFKNLEEILPSNWDAFVRGKTRFEPIAKALHERTVALYDQAGLDPRAFPIYEQPVF